MRITNNDERKMKDYFKKRKQDLNIYFLCNDLLKCLDISNLKYNSVISIDDSVDLTYLKNKTSYELRNYDLIIVSNSNYNISFSEQLRTMTRKLAIENNKNMMAIYHYGIENKNEDEIRFFFEAPSFESTEIIEIDKTTLDVLKLLDIATYKYDEKDKLTNVRSKVLTLK